MLLSVQRIGFQRFLSSSKDQTANKKNETIIQPPVVDMKNDETAVIDYGYGDATATTDYGYGDTTNTTDYGYGDATTTTTDYGYGDATATTDYGYGDATTTDYGYGDDDTKTTTAVKQDTVVDSATTDYGYGNAADYGYGETDYGYGDSYQTTPKEKPQAAAAAPRRTRTVRRNSCVIRNQGDNRLAVAEFLVGGPPPMSDRDMHTTTTTATQAATVTADSTSTDYGYGNTTADYGYGNTATDYGYGNTATDYGYGETDYGYGDSHQTTPSVSQEPAAAAAPRRTRTVRRNSCVIRNQGENRLAVAEFLVGGPPPMSDRDMQQTEAANQATAVAVR